MHASRLESPTTATIKPRLDYTNILQNADAIATNIQQRKYDPIDMKNIVTLCQKRLDIYKTLVQLKTMRNELSKSAQTQHDAVERQRIIDQGRKIKSEIKSQEQSFKHIESELMIKALVIPNDTHPNAPVGDINEARLVKSVGKPLPRQEPNGFVREDHVSIMRRLGLVDFEQAALVSGASFYYLQGMGAFLETALVQYALDCAHRRGFTAVLTPDIVRTSIAYGCGFQPRTTESSHIYRVSTGDHNDSSLCLAGTAEIPLAGKFATRILDEADLPQRLVGFGHAFRSEAGGRGTEPRGLYRVHQFSKVELFAVTTPQQSEAMLKEFCDFQQEIVSSLGLTYRVLDMPTEELGASAYRKYDVEAWMPGRETWGEISSTSNCTDYQARRLDIRYRPRQHGGHQATDFCHTLNGTAIAVPRVIIAILETFQRPDGTVDVPPVIRRWIPGQPSVIG